MYNVVPVTVILGFLLTNGHLVALVVSAVLLFTKPVARAQSVGKRAAVDAGSVPAGGVEPWLREILQEKLDVAERADDEGAVKKIRALCPELVSKDRGDGGVDLWISLTKQMQQLQQQQLQLVEAAARHKHKAAE